MQLIEFPINLPPKGGFFLGVCHIGDITTHAILSGYFCNKISAESILLILELWVVFALLNV
jgi:hypothetical protein